jgi:parvulin-like peptidyl-prolyl isomerase
MVEKYSDDTGTKQKGGKFRPVKLGEPRVSPEYTEGLFSIENVGEYSDVVSSRFGLHIIRLDEIEPAYYKPFDEVKGKVLAAIETKYRQLAAMEFDRQYAPTENFTIDEAALEKMLAPYRTNAAGAKDGGAGAENGDPAGSGQLESGQLESE